MRFLKMTLFWTPLLAALTLFSGCTRHEIQVKPVEIKPIHLTIDINLRIERAEKDLEDFFGDLDQMQAE